MKTFPYITVCVPVYNEAAEIERFIAMMKNQSFQWFTLLFLNDGSKDNSLRLLQEYGHKGLACEIISQENQGLPSARNNLKAAVKTKYFTFIDIDDVIPPDYLQQLYTTAENNNGCTVFCSHRYIMPNGEHKFRKYRGPVNLSQELVIRYLCSTDIADASWAKLFPTQNALSADYPIDLKIGDDLCTVYRLMSNAVYCPTTHYGYVIDNAGLATRFCGLDYLKGARRRIRAVRHKIREKKYTVAHLCTVYLLLAEQYKSHGSKPRYINVLRLKSLRLLPNYLTSHAPIRTKLSTLMRIVRL